MIFHLSWHQHGGSGLAITFSDALDLSLQDRDWFVEHIGAERVREARELQKARR